MRKQNFLKVLIVPVVFVTALFGCASNRGGVSLSDMKELSKNHALVVVYNAGIVKTYDDNGIKPLFEHLESGDFKNTYVFDKVTGRASAMILAYGGAENLYTGVLSKEAVPVLNKYRIKYSADKIVDHIINKTGDDKCPMEKAVEGVDDPAQAYKILKEKFGN